MSNNKTIGFDRKIELSWLDATAYWTSQGLSKDDTHQKLYELLDGRLSDQGERSTRRKTITVLLHIWRDVPDFLKAFRDEGISLYRRYSGKESVALHWGMCLATYPFFCKAAEVIGKLLELQQYVTTSQVHRRMQEVYGERSTLIYAIRRVLPSISSWGLLDRKKKPGDYKPKEKIDLCSKPGISEWLVEALLYGSSTKIIPYEQLASVSALFPFGLTISLKNIASNPRLDLFHQALDETVVILKTQRQG